jgi:apoptosis-stimulating of p53 protein 1
MTAAANELVEEEMEELDEEAGLNVPEFESNPETKKEKPPGIIKRLRQEGSDDRRGPRRVSFDPLALLLDASLEGELELVKRTAREVSNPSAANDEGITALHNAICAGHFDIVR